MFSYLISRLRSIVWIVSAAGLCVALLPGAIHAQHPPYAEWPDDHWAEVAGRVPGFAGWWLDGGTIVLMLVDTTQREAALSAIRPELPPRYINNIRVQKADFDFRHLRDWKDLVIGDSAVVMSDADEVRNRVVAGVPDSASLAPTRRRLLAMRIPTEALVVEVTGRLRYD